MTDTEINIAIAEACGWALVKDDPDFYEYWEHPKDGRKIGVAANSSPFPDYCNDLNAIHEAEKVLNDVSYDSYWSNLVFVCIQSNMERLNSATARQRAEAFLRTIGKWKDVQP